MNNHTLCMIKGKANAMSKTINETSFASGVWIAPEPSIFLNHTKAVPTTNKINQKRLTIHQNIQLIFK